VNSHLVLMMLFSIFVSVVFSALMRDDPAEQVLFAGKLFAGFVAAGILAGWILYPLPF
jgi:hypothetical protein